MATPSWIGTTDGKFLTENANWDGVAPATGDSARIPATATRAIDEQLDATAVLLHGFDVEENAAVAMGKWTAPTIREYLQLTMKDTSYFDANLGGIGESYLDFTNYKDIYVTKAASPSTGKFGLNLIGTLDAGTNGNIYITSKVGTIGLAANLAEVLEATKIWSTDAKVTIGSGVVAYDASATTILDCVRGTILCKATLAAITSRDTELRYEGGSIAAINGISGTITHAGTGTITQAILDRGATLDMTGDKRPKVITDITMRSGSTLDIRGGHVTLTNSIVTDGCGHDEVRVIADVGQVIAFA